MQLRDDACTRCGHSKDNHVYRGSGDDRPSACQYVGDERCDCPGYTPRVDPLPPASLDFDEGGE